MPSACGGRYQVCYQGLPIEACCRCKLQAGRLHRRISKLSTSTRSVSMIDYTLPYVIFRSSSPLAAYVSCVYD